VGVGGVVDVFFSSRRRHTRLVSDWSSDVCSSDLALAVILVCWQASSPIFFVKPRLLARGQGGTATPVAVTLTWPKNALAPALPRSEERRVGKESRSRWAAGE